MISTTIKIVLLLSLIILPLFGPKRRSVKKYNPAVDEYRSEYVITEYGDIEHTKDEFDKKL